MTGARPAMRRLLAPLLLARVRAPRAVAMLSQGASEASAKTRPIVPAVDGTVIKMPATRPAYAVARLKTGLRNMTAEMIRRATALRT